MCLYALSLLKRDIKFYNLESKTFIVSRDVVFHEYQPPFVDSSFPFIEDPPPIPILNSTTPINHLGTDNYNPNFLPLPLIKYSNRALREN